jgi:hypothetical protein
MTAKTMRYTLENINAIIFDGFDYKLPTETLEIISKLSSQVGSPDYIKTPIFVKRENPMKVEPFTEASSSASSSASSCLKKPKRGKAMEVFNDEDWNQVKTFQTTKIDEKTGIHVQIDNIRTHLNKMTDKNYLDMSNKIKDIIDKLIEDKITTEDMSRFSSIIFDIASTNRFYSRIYADLYAELSSKYKIMLEVFENNFNQFMELFNTIEYVDPQDNYDKFCDINKANEKRKSLATFYLNLMNNGIVSERRIQEITRNLLAQLYAFISVESKKNEVDELAETIAILYKKEMYVHDVGSEYEKIDGQTINETINKIANSKVKDYKSLTNKTLFKFMDLTEA